VSRAAGVPRSTAHSALKSLAKRGLIFCEGRYPARFAAAPVTRLESLAASRLALARRALAAARLVARFGVGPKTDGKG
jgi:sugar-specific transcriptional regulator TrmB